jgi:protein involved in ribonucleotide reduction
MLDIIYYSNRSGNTKRFAEKIGLANIYNVSEIPVALRDYILFVPTYGAGNDGFHIPQAVKTFLSIKTNSERLKAIVGFGNKNFGDTYCKAAELLSKKFGVPILGRVELFGTPEDVVEIQERLRKFNDTIQLP